MSAPQVRARRRSTAPPLPQLLGAIVLGCAAVVFGGLAADPIYQSGRLWLVLGVAAAVTFALVWAGARWRWGALTIAAILSAFVVLVVPLAVSDALASGPAGLVRGLGDGLAAVALGWKQLLTLTLPVGSYQTVLVPALVTIMLSVALSTTLAFHGGRLAALAAIPMLLPVLFGTVFGASSVSGPITIGAATVIAPRELVVWLCAFGLGAAWVAWSSGAKRRAALRLGREPEAPRGRARRGAAVRATLAGATVAVALLGGLAIAPALGGDARTVPRDRIDPELVVREQTSPLAGYRTWKRDALFGAPVFEVAASGALPHRLRIAVLDTYDGVDFSVSSTGGSGRFTRFPSGERMAESSRVKVVVDAGYQAIWVPLTATIGGPPSFTGNRADALGDSFYLNRETGSAVAVPTAVGLRVGDGYEAEMSLAVDATLSDDPADAEPLLDLETTPELNRWLTLQQLPATGEGVQTAIERLRERGYLSHSLTDGEGERDWLTTLSAEYGTKFVTSPGGHSMARIEQLFKQLSDQQNAAGERPSESMLVAGIGDDEQFATAAALVARAMGFDSRVVLGVRLGGAEQGVPGVPACAETCTGENITAWVELRGADAAWAALDVSPQVANPPTTLDEGEQLPEYPTTPETRDASESDPSVGMSESDDSDNNNEEDSLSALWPVLRAMGLSFATLALFALLFLFIPFVKWLRTKSRRAATQPEIWALGAWDELLDTYVDSGSKISRGGSRLEAADRLGIPSGEWIAWNVDRAVYSREGVDQAEAEQLWQVVDARIGERRAELGKWARMRARYSLASFGVTSVAELRQWLSRRRRNTSTQHGSDAARGDS